ncbi:methylenetetrahydrofolate reductase-domain-containing protein [Pisolithus sp. B1]|nr:methylenetetrahydrofolate reductase-domain-containing protein [Pisolithus sp. B1]
MKLSDKLAVQPTHRPFYTFEFFPPRTDQGFDNLLTRISRLSTLDPIAISVTWGAGGSTKDGSLDLAGITQADYGIDTILHLTCTNMVPGLVDDVLRVSCQPYVNHDLSLYPPRGQEHWTPIDSRFSHGVDLVKYIRSSPEFSPHFCIGVAAYPEGHPDNQTDDDGNFAVLKEKVEAGADFIVTQLFYDADRFLHWLERIRRQGISVPIIPGVMPIQTYSSFLRVVSLCGIQVPSSIMADLESIRHDDQLVKDYGIRVAVDIIHKITGNGGVRGVHFCTLNLEKSVQLVLERLRWVGGSPNMRNKLIADSPVPLLPNSELVVTPATATTNAAAALTSKTTVEVEPPGRGELNNAATWDDFPNGRFGDYKSPAFGVQDQWGGLALSVHAVHPDWGHPTSMEELTDLFLRYLDSKVTSTPFSSSPLSAESQTILHQLKALTRKGLWTVCSQPAVDTLPSTDEIFGWGPRGGYVSQKAFIEFFSTEEVVDEIEKKIRSSGGRSVHYFAANLQGDFRSNVQEDARNAVTWGVFPRKGDSDTDHFQEEAFSIWAEWASFYPPGASQRTTLDEVRRTRWLVNVLHHDFKDPGALWDFLADFYS